MPGDTPDRTGTPGRRWWLRMLIASLAVAGLLLGTHHVIPAARLHYHAWRYRTDHDPDGDSLRKVADWAVRYRLPRDAIVRLLSRPAVEERDRLDYQAPGRLWNINGAMSPVKDAGLRIVLEQGQATGLVEHVDLPFFCLRIVFQSAERPAVDRCPVAAEAHELARQAAAEALANIMAPSTPSTSSGQASSPRQCSGQAGQGAQEREQK